MPPYKDPEKKRDAQRAATARYVARHPDRIRLGRVKSREKFKAENPAGYKAYRRGHGLKRKGLSVAEYDALLDKQGGRCAIGGHEFGERGPQVDHDHACCPGNKSCGKCVRALLCHHCNMGLGRFRDSPELLRFAANYLENTTR